MQVWALISQSLEQVETQDGAPNLLLYLQEIGNTCFETLEPWAEYFTQVFFQRYLI